MLKEAILSLALQLYAGPIYGKYTELETQEQYQERLEVISEAIVIESSPEHRYHLWKWDTKSLAIAVLVTWFFESRFDLRVHQGVKHPRYSQDNGRARCLGQIHVGIVDKKTWKSLAGTDLKSTRNCAKATVKALARWSYRCKYYKRDVKKLLTGHMIGIFGGYKTGRGCHQGKFAVQKARLWDDLRRRSETILLTN